MITSMNPDTIRELGAGRVLARVIEKMGGVSRGGIFIPATVQDHGGKDTVMCEVVRVGPAPRRRLRSSIRAGYKYPDWIDADTPWPDDYAPLKEGDVVIAPRDVELAFGFEEERYVILVREELIAVVEDARVEVVPQARLDYIER